MNWVMWEVKAADGQTDALVAWVLENAPAAAQVYRSEDRVVVITDHLPDTYPEPPATLVTRAPAAWWFDRLR